MRFGKSVYEMLRRVGRRIVTLPSYFSKNYLNLIVKRLRHANFHYRLDPNRVRTKDFLSQFPVVGEHQYRVGSYYLDRRVPLSKESTVYSLGVGGDVDFDLAVSHLTGCHVQLYDPTPFSIEMMKEIGAEYPKLHFEPFGIWTEDTMLRFHYPSYGGSASATLTDGRGVFFEAQCKTFVSVMKENGHTKCDVLKMDIEGAALPVLKQLIESGIVPDQVIAEFERPRRNAEVIDQYFTQLSSICECLAHLGYQVVRLPREHARYFSVELLFSKIEPSDNN